MPGKATVITYINLYIPNTVVDKMVRFSDMVRHILTVGRMNFASLEANWVGVMDFSLV